MRCALLWQILSSALLVCACEFRFIGTNAYWLHALNSDEDIENTLVNMSANGIRVVRTWAFNDVDTVPENGTWFQLISNGTTTINNGTNGLPRLDKVVELAEKHGIYLQMVLTNNWNPRPLEDGLNLTDTLGAFGLSPRDVTPDTNNSLPRNTLSNDYGGMDVYVRQIGQSREHDQFYVNATIIDAFLNYTNAVVTRYMNSSAVFGWELANDPRLSLMQFITASSSMRNTDVTMWHSIRKLYRKKWRAASQPSTAKGGVRVRGRWVSTPTRRQDLEDDIGIGSAFDGSHGVDSEDILSIPEIGYGTFQLFPDQNSYGLDSPLLSPFNNTLQEGLDWITRQAQTAQAFGVPISLTGFGLVTQNNAPFFVPFNSSIAPFGPDNAPATPGTAPFGVTDPQRDDAYQQWINAGIVGGLNGIIQYQWGQGNLTTQQGTEVAPANTESGVGPAQDTSGVSPNDGYSIQGVGQPDVVSTLQQGAQAIAPDT
ncbi:glycoside hydrolase superfamily [Infundibulicybe gibba]|nr:glycoside hydrolase superfamily [Infundibulicybe gibba]